MTNLLEYVFLVRDLNDLDEENNIKDETLFSPLIGAMKTEPTDKERTRNKFNMI